MSESVWIIEYEQDGEWLPITANSYLSEHEARADLRKGEQVSEYRRVEKEDRKP